VSERSSHHAIITGGSGRLPWSRWRKTVAMVLLLQIVAAGCSGARPPVTVPESPTTISEVDPFLELYENQLYRNGMSAERASAYLAGEVELAALDGDGANGDPPADPSPERLSAATQDPTQQGVFQSWGMVDGVAEYRIGPQDVLLVTAFLGPETPAALSYRVQADGSISISRFGIGRVQAGGLTVTELTRRLSDAFRRYVPAGSVDVRVDEYNAWTATLVGEIRTGQGIGPGSYPLRGRQSLGDFVFAHGGPTPGADLSDVRIVRNGVEYSNDLAAALAGQGGTNPPVDAGDIVRVLSAASGSSRYFIFGEVNSPGVYTVTADLTILDAIAQAGAYTPDADGKRVFISRSSTAEVLPVNLEVVLGEAQFSGDLQLQAGDFIVVPTRPPTFWEKTRDWIGLTTLVLAVASIIALIQN